jgi:hypothetical protein
MSQSIKEKNYEGKQEYLVSDEGFDEIWYPICQAFNAIQQDLMECPRIKFDSRAYKFSYDSTISQFNIHTR